MKDPNIAVQCFSRATVNYIKHYIEPMNDKKQLNKIVVNMGPNELPTDKSPNTIAPVIKLAQ